MSVGVLLHSWLVRKVRSLDHCNVAALDGKSFCTKRRWERRERERERERSEGRASSNFASLTLCAEMHFEVGSWKFERRSLCKARSYVRLVLLGLLCSLVQAEERGRNEAKAESWLGPASEAIPHCFSVCVPSHTACLCETSNCALVFVSLS